MKQIFTNNPVWDNEQQIVLNSNPNIIVTGGAGSGKTLLVIFLAKQLFDKGERKIVILVYTKSLRTFIKSMLQNFKLDDIDVLYQNEWNKYNKQNYDYTILDEAQDFSLEDIFFYKEKSKKGIYIFIDDNQRIYEKNLKGINTVTFTSLTEKLKLPVITLKNNYRISNSIAAFIKMLFPETSLYPLNSIGEFKVLFVKLTNTNQELDYIKNYLNANNEDIGILLSENDSTSDNYFYNGRNMVVDIPGIIEVKDYLSSLSKNIGYKYRSNDNLIFDNEKNINIMTIHSSKGLQFGTVILPFNNNAILKMDSKSVLYVGLTRCINKLIITYTDVVSNQFDALVERESYNGELRKYIPNIDCPPDILAAERLLRSL